ncbi:STAS domain-containing protein [Nonomuraea sp. NPDC001023]|uniref:STAS domain-containing protein n=1 Tax=unclassified Nonomuraea TaxID=2593643 RepID=UPI003327F9B9
MMQLSVRLVPVGDTTLVVALAGELDSTTSPILAAFLDPLPRSRVKHVIVAAGDLWFCDLNGLEQLAITHRAMQEKGGHLAVAEAQPALCRLIALMTEHGGTAIPLFSTMPDALAGTGVEIYEQTGPPRPVSRHLACFRRARGPRSEHHGTRRLRPQRDETPITPDRQENLPPPDRWSAIVGRLRSANAELLRANEELRSANAELRHAHDALTARAAELRRANDALVARMAELDEVARITASLVHGLGDAAVVLDADMRVLIWGAEAEELWGVRAGEAVGRPLASLGTGLPVERIVPLVRDTPAGGTARAGARTVALDAVNGRGRPTQLTVELSRLRPGDDSGHGLIIAMKVPRPGDSHDR